MHRAFHAERRNVEKNICPCKSCTQTSGLKLKFVAHVGDVASQTIKRHKKLIGVDVIYVHRMLKNSVEVPEYILVSDDLHRDAGAAASALSMQEITQDIEGVGQVETFFVNIDDVDPAIEPLPEPSWRQRLGNSLGMIVQGLPHVFARG
jgi:hypothetical protein